MALKTLWQLRSNLVNLFLSIRIPVDGAIAGNEICGQVYILHKIQFCGLVESVLGIGTGVSGRFGSDYLMDRFFQKTNAVVSFDKWKKVPAGKRKVMEEAAYSLGRFL